MKTHSFKPTCSPPHTHLITIYSRDLQSTPHILTKDVCPLGEFVSTNKCTYYVKHFVEKRFLNKMFYIPLGNRAKQTLGQYYMGLYFKHSFIPKKMAYQEVLKQGFLISNVENCVSTVNNIKWFWGIICCCYVSNHKFNLKTQRTTWKFSAWATKFRNTFI